MQSRRAIETERLLAAAGFQMQLAHTPQRVAQLEALEQRKLVAHPRNGSVYVVYADASSCQCLYAGTEQAYRRYRKLALALFSHGIYMSPSAALHSVAATAHSDEEVALTLEAVKKALAEAEL